MRHVGIHCLSINEEVGSGFICTFMHTKVEFGYAFIRIMIKNMYGKRHVVEK